jgi:hypothetical protein
MKWFVRFTDNGSEHLSGPHNTEEIADAFVATCEEHEATNISKFEEVDDYHVSSQVLHVATVTKNDGVYRVYSDGHEELDE